MERLFRVALSGVVLTVLPMPMFAQKGGGFGGGGMGGGGFVVRERMKRDRPADFKLLEKVKKADIVVVTGSFDHVETVLSFVKVPHLVLDPEDLAEAQLNAGQLVVVNCPGNISEKAIEKLRKFVRAGGFLFTTDWCLLNVLEKAFPGVVAFNKQPTKDDVVEVRVLKEDNEFLRHVKSARDAPKWWLEGSSYPIRILDKGRVEVLIVSEELRRKYGEAPVAISFREGDGKVLHIVSHYYLQRTETRTGWEKGKGSDFAKDLNVKLTSEAKKALDSVTAGEARDAYSASQLSANVIIAKQKHNQSLRAIYTHTVKSQVSLRSSPASGAKGTSVESGLPVKVLQKQSSWSRVQTYRGDLGWIESDRLTKR